MVRFGLALFLAAAALPTAAAPAITSCFTPGQDGTGLIVDTIGAAERQIRVQAYSFTSAPIAKALADAYRRGVDVQVILDKSQIHRRDLSAKRRRARGDRLQVAIAHNKVMVIDGATVITGSFNFTKAAQDKNAENLLVLHDAELARQYLTNWESRLAVSKPYKRE
ncbi:phospholipase D family protein [Dongia soli]|uniref:Phospholipase D n=1 Tax=Dongia soli TaxID=600628 RepID=A0ABU5EG66_9PROT|nr:phospholipase D family protein [Dongia soli]MDY0885404.1 phospholipase D family protein [Dongia soli]